MLVVGSHQAGAACFLVEHLAAARRYAQAPLRSSTVMHSNGQPADMEVCAALRLCVVVVQAMGQDCDLLGEVCGWINAKATKPVWAKMTPNITDITLPAAVAAEQGAQG